MSRTARSIVSLAPAVAVLFFAAGGSSVSVASPIGSGRVAGEPSSNCWQSVHSRNFDRTADNQLLAVDGLSSTDVWAVGTHVVGSYDQTLGEHWDGSSWRLSRTADVGINTDLVDVVQIGATDVWAVGDYNTYTALAEHWDGTGWFVTSPTPVGALSELNGVDGTASTDVWAVGFYTQTLTSPNQTLAYLWDGLQWAQVPTPNGGPGDSFLNQVDVLSPSDAWAVGQFVPTGQSAIPLIEHWNGSAWTVAPSPQIAGATLLGVSAISSTDVWAVGWAAGAGVTLHWDGVSWTEVPSPQVGVETYLQDVDGTSSNDVWAVGYSTPDSESWHTVILRWDGVKWRVYPHPNPLGPYRWFYGVAAIPGGEAWAVGSSLWSGPAITYTQRYSAC